MPAADHSQETGPVRRRANHRQSWEAGMTSPTVP